MGRAGVCARFPDLALRRDNALRVSLRNRARSPRRRARSPFPIASSAGRADPPLEGRVFRAALRRGGGVGTRPTCLERTGRRERRDALARGGPRLPAVPPPARVGRSISSPLLTLLRRSG